MGPFFSVAVDNSETMAEVINSTISSTIMTNASNCASKNNSAQNIVIGQIEITGCNKVNIGASQVMKSSSDFSCINSNANASDVKNDLSNNIMRKFDELRPPGFLVGVSVDNSKKVSKETNETVNLFNLSNLSSCSTDNVNTQNISIGEKGIKINCSNPYNATDKIISSSEKVVNLDDISQIMNSQLVSKCVSDNTNVNKLANTLTNTLLEERDAANEVMLIIVIVSVIAVIIIFIIIGFIIRHFINKSASLAKVGMGLSMDMPLLNMKTMGNPSNQIDPAYGKIKKRNK